MRSASVLAIAMCVAVVACDRQGAPKARLIPDARNISSSHPPRQGGSATTNQPLAARAPSNAGMHFERLGADVTGIDFVHRWNPPAKHDRELANAVAGGGVAIGDYDGDGRPDLLLTRPQGGCQLYRNLGHFRFENVTQKAGIDPTTWGTGAAFADIDGDADQDLYLCAFDGPNRLYVNQGDGSFREQSESAGLAYHGSSIMMAFADYDLDGDLDAYLVTNRLSPSQSFQARAELRHGKWQVPAEVIEYKDVLVKPDGTPFPIDAGQFDHLYRNEGKGSDGQVHFRDVSREAGIEGNHFGLSASWWDFDDDGYPDLYVSNDFFGPDQLYRNNGNGRFTDVTRFALPHTPWFSMGTDAADLNNDGRLDFMASDMSGMNHFKQKVAMGEMGETGWFLTYPTPRQYMRNAVYLNTGTGRFMEVAYLAGLADTNWTWSLNFADFDNDSRVDLFVSNGMTRDWFHSDLRAEARRRGEWQEGAREFWLSSPQLRERNLAFRNLGDLNFTEVGASWKLDHLGVSFGAAAADLDGDGDQDLVVNNFTQPVGIYRNQSTAGHLVIVQLQGVSSNLYGIGASVRVNHGEVTQVRQVWPTHGFMSASPPVAHFGLGQRTQIDKLTVRWPSGRVQELHNLPADRLYTLAEPADAPRPVTPPSMPQFARDKSLPLIAHQEDDYDDFADQPLLPNRLSRLGPGMAWGDADNDGHEDLFVGGAAEQPGTLLMYRDGQFVPTTGPFTDDARCEDMGTVWLDIEGDGDLDLYVASGHSADKNDRLALRDRLYLNDGRGELTKAADDALPDEAVSDSAVAAADFDRDGDLDLFVGARCVPGRYPVTPASRLLRNDSSSQGHVRLVDVTDVSAPTLRHAGMVTSALWSDVDQDDWPDLWVTCDWGPARLFRNRGGQLSDATSQGKLNDRLGWWNSIVAGDLDSDGDQDYLLTNFGLNTKYHASAEHPLQLFYGDFEGNGNLQLVEAEYEGETLYPVRGRSCSSRAMPTLAARFPTFESFALAQLSDVYQQDALNKSLKLSINELQTGVLINDGHSKFTFLPLPRLAQASPAFGAVAAELDGDGNVDLFLGQNFYSAQPETGHMDGGVGQLVLGKPSDGRAGWQVVDARDSGIVLAGAVASLTTHDLNGDGWLDVVAALNNGPLLAFTNRGQSGRRSMTVALRGRAGNLLGTGARVTVRYDNGRQMNFEIHSGSGYLSQSSNRLAFGSDAASQVKAIEVRWPDGLTTIVQPPATASHLEIRQVKAQPTAQPVARRE
jgi:hypothetical protein